MQHHEIANMRVVFDDEHTSARLTVGLGRVSRCHSSSLAPSRFHTGYATVFSFGCHAGVIAVFVLRRNQNVCVSGDAV